MWDLSLSPGAKNLRNAEMHSFAAIKEKRKPEIVQNPDDLYHSLRFLLMFGRMIGVVPLQGLFQPFSENLRFKWRSQAALYSVTVCIFLTGCSIINGIVNFQNAGSSPADLAWAANLAVYYAIGSFMHVFMLKQAHMFIRLLKKWRESFSLDGWIDQNLSRDVHIISICMYTSCILEHSYAHFKFFPFVENAERRLFNRLDLQQRLENASAWEIYYWRSHPFVGDLIPYSFAAAFTIFVCSKYCILSWNFGDILIAVMSRALSHRFKMVYEQAKKELIFDGGYVSKSSEKWRQLTIQHEKLRDLVLEFNEFLGPLIFTQLGANLFSFCLQLNLGLTPKANTTLIASVYAIWSFLHLSMRILVPAIAASNVNVHAHKIAAILKKCPIQCYTPEIERAERTIRSSRIGLSGLGCFTITRPFLLQIINVVFTLEVVLLQSSN